MSIEVKMVFILVLSTSITAVVTYIGSPYTSRLLKIASTEGSGYVAQRSRKIFTRRLFWILAPDAYGTVQRNRNLRHGTMVAYCRSRYFAILTVKS